MTQKAPDKLPSLFLGHGAPDLPLSDHPAKAFLQKLSGTLQQPKAIIVISAHWQTAQLSVTGAGELETIHDYMGFKRELYDLHYAAHAPFWLVERMKKIFRDTNYGPIKIQQRGLDHGAWVPLSLIYPKAEIPIVQLSLLHGASPHRHFEVGRLLTPLRDEGYLIIGSGSTAHNLMEIMREGSTPPDWAIAFDDWLYERLNRGDLDELFDYEKQAPSPHRAHPTPEHLAPLFVMLGAGTRRIKRLHHSYSYGSLGMSVYKA